MAVAAGLVLVLALTPALAPPAGAGAAPATIPETGAPPGTPPVDLWAEEAVRYVQDPRRHREFVKRFARVPPESLPAVVALLLADARFREGQHRAAARLLERVLDELPDERGTSARMLLAYIAFADGDVATLDALEEPLSSFSPATGDVAAVLRELAASAAEPEASAGALEQLAGSPDLVPALRVPVGYAAALARLWAGDPGRAATRLDALARDRDAGNLADDVRYAAAIARWHTGAQAEALAALDDLAALGDAARPVPAFTRARLLLARDAVLRGGTGTLRRRPPGAPDATLSTMLDADGIALARRAAAELREPPPPPDDTAVPASAPATQRVARPEEVVPTAGRQPDVPAARAPAGAPRPPDRSAGPARRTGFWVWGVVAAAIVAAAGWLLRRAATRSGPASPRARGR